MNILLLDVKVNTFPATLGLAEGLTEGESLGLDDGDTEGEVLGLSEGESLGLSGILLLLCYSIISIPLQFIMH